MSWYSSDYPHRWPVAVDNSAGGTSAIDIQFTIPKELEEFWANVQSDGADIRVTDADGTTDLTFQRSSWTYASRTGVIQVDDWTPPSASAVCMIWLYWGYASASDAAGSFTASGPLTGYIYPATPTDAVFDGGPEQHEVANPTQRIAKTTDMTIMPWTDVAPLLADVRTAYEDHNEYEEIEWVKLEALKAGTDQTAERDLSKIRFLDRGLVRGHLTAGTDTEDRTLSWQISTTEGRILNPRAWVSLNDPDETV